MGYYSPQQSGVAEKESVNVIFHQSSSDSEMEAYKTSRLEKQREKAKQPSFDLFKKTIENLQACSNETLVTNSVYSHCGEGAKQQVWKNDMWKVILIHQGKSTITSKRIYEIMLRAEMERCLKLSRNCLFGDRLKDIEMSYHHVRV